MANENVPVSESLDVTQTPAAEVPTEVVVPVAPVDEAAQAVAREKMLSGIGEGQPTAGGGN